VYLGLDGGEPRFRLDAERAGLVQRFEATAIGRWEVLGANGATAVLERFPDLGEDRYRLELEISDADEQSARVAVTSSLRLAYEGWRDVAGPRLADVISPLESAAALIGCY